MTPDPDPDQYPKLADLNVDKVRAENDHVDNRIAELESQVSDLQSEKATLEDEKSSIEDEKEAAKALLADFRDDQRDQQMKRIREANEAVSEDNEVDLSTLEDADVDQLETVADMVETAAEAATGQPSNANRRPDIDADPSDVDGGDVDLDDLKRQVAESEGLGRLYEKAQNGGFDVDHSDLGTAGTNGGGNITAQDLLDAAENVEGGR